MHTRSRFTVNAGAIMLALAAAASTSAVRADGPDVLLVIKGNRFDPAEIKVPANQRVKLVVHNQDASAEEFESHQLNREKIVPPNAKVSIFIGPLKPGRYEFWGEYHADTAKGVVIAQ